MSSGFSSMKDSKKDCEIKIKLNQAILNPQRVTGIVEGLYSMRLG